MGLNKKLNFAASVRIVTKNLPLKKNTIIRLIQKKVHLLLKIFFRACKVLKEKKNTIKNEKLLKKNL